MTSNSTLSTKGQLVIPAKMRKAMNLKAGDKVSLKLEGQQLIVQPASLQRPKLRRGRFGRLVLVAAKDSPPMTLETVNRILEELP